MDDRELREDPVEEESGNEGPGEGAGAGQGAQAEGQEDRGDAGDHDGVADGDPGVLGDPVLEDEERAEAERPGW